MPHDFSLRIYVRDPNGRWMYEEFNELPVSRPCIIVLHVNHEDAQSDLDELLKGIRSLLNDLKASPESPSAGDWHDVNLAEANYLHVVVCEGNRKATLEPAVLQDADKSDRVWILPVLKRKDANKVANLLDEGLGKRNVAFWEQSIAELSLTMLARAGVTTLDRRVFISYRRTDTSPLADQLFDVLTRRNFQVFLDRVSVEPGVDFQAALFEQLADKSMVVLLNSKDFPNSRWTMEEIRFARERRLSLLILRLPDALNGLGATGSEELLLADDDVASIEVPGFSAKQKLLRQEALGEILRRILFQHDRELIGRFRDMRSRVLEAAQFASRKAQARGKITLTCIPSKSDLTVTINISDPRGVVVRQYTVYPSAYPPFVPELYNAAVSTRAVMGKRLVVGHTASMLTLRTSQLDWIVDGRNVGYHDIDALSLLFDLMEEGSL